MHENSLGTEKITTLFFRYAIPSIMGLLLMSIYTIIDGIFVGNFVGPSALASINITLPGVHIIIAISIVIAIGSQSLMGIKLGEGKLEAAQDVFKTAFLLVLAISFGVGLVFFLWSSSIVTLFGASVVLAKDAANFLQLSACFLPLFGGMVVCDFALKTVGRPVYSAMLMLVSVVTNIVLDYIFIVHLNFGIQGAALATGISYIVAFIMAIVPFLYKEQGINLWAGRFHWKLAGKMIYNGSSEGLSELAAGFTTLLFNITLMRQAGEVGVVAFTIINYINFLGIAMLMGLAEGIGPIVSYNFGSRQFARSKSVLKIAWLGSAIVGGFLFVALFSYSPQLIGLFIGENVAEVSSFAVQGVRLYAIAFLISGLNLVSASYFTALGRPKQAATIVVLRGFVFLSIGMMTLPYFIGIHGIWLTVPFAEILTFIITLILVKKSMTTLSLHSQVGSSYRSSPHKKSLEIV